MTQINPKKLLHSKWTAVAPMRREKHFIVTKVHSDASGTVHSCTIEAVHSHNERELPWRELKDTDVWQMGWR